MSRTDAQNGLDFHFKVDTNLFLKAAFQDPDVQGIYLITDGKPVSTRLTIF
jgi:hypothetical protein